MTYIGTSPQCERCRHCVPEFAVDDRPGPLRVYGVCAAFPTGIPSAIWTVRFDHRRPFPGDHGIHWEPVAADTVHPRTFPRPRGGRRS